MNNATFRRAAGAAIPLACLVGLLASSQPGGAASVPWGTVLVPGSAWAGSYARLGDLNVYSNGTGDQDQDGPYGLDYECFELAARWAQIAYGDPHNGWDAYYAYQMFDTGPYQNPPFLQRPNGGGVMPEFGDLLVFGETSFDPGGHVAVVTAVGVGFVDVVEQNWGDPNPTGEARLPIGADVNGVWNPTYMPARWGLPVRGWLHSSVAPTGVGATGVGIYLPADSSPASPSGRLIPTIPSSSPSPVTAPPTTAPPSTWLPGVSSIAPGSATPTQTVPSSGSPPHVPADYYPGAHFLPTAGTVVVGGTDPVSPPNPSPPPAGTPVAGAPSVQPGIDQQPGPEDRPVNPY